MFVLENENSIGCNLIELKTTFIAEIAKWFGNFGEQNEKIGCECLSKEIFCVLYIRGFIQYFRVKLNNCCVFLVFSY